MRIKLLLAALVCAAYTCAQPAASESKFNGTGYYRIQNMDTKRYITVRDGYGTANFNGRTADPTALLTVMDWNRVSSDASSVIYIEQKSSLGYGMWNCNLIGQGVNTYDFFNVYLKLDDMGDGTFRASASASKGSGDNMVTVTMYLGDKVYAVWAWDTEPEESEVGVTEDNKTKGIDWYVIPVNTSSNYFGIKPDVTAGSEYYKAFCASFPYSFASQGMKAYTISAIDESKGAAVIQEVSGTVAAGTPVIIKCGSADPASNKLSITGAPKTGKKPITSAGNSLKGVYFCHPDGVDEHRDAVAYDPATMRVLGATAGGKLAFIKATGLDYIPANSCYITVSASAPEVIYAVEENSPKFTNSKGDITGDGKINTTDIVSVLNAMKAANYRIEADVNNDGKVNVTDIVSILNIMKSN